MSILNIRTPRTLLVLLASALFIAACGDFTAPSNEPEGSGPGYQSSLDSTGPGGEAAAKHEAGTAMTPSAESTVLSSLALATAQSNGFQCLAGAMPTVRQKMPTMTSISGRIETVRFTVDLYRWNPALNYGRGNWEFVRRKDGYRSAASAGGNLEVPYFSPAKWQIGGSALRDNSDDFSSVQRGYYYTTQEWYFWQNGASASLWNAAYGKWCLM